MYKKQDPVISIALIAIILSSVLLTLVNAYGKPLYQQKTNLMLTEFIVHRLVDEISKEIEMIRGLRFTKPPEIKIVDTSWAIETWVPKESIEIPKELLYKEMMLKLSLLIPYNRAIIQLERSWVGMFAAAVAGTTIYINIDYFKPSDPSSRNLLAHELTHILQFLNFKIEYPDTLDSRLALMALIEGDAGLVQHLYCNKTKLCTPSPSVGLYLSDMYISLNLFPYIYGENFVRYLYEYGGWELVNKAYQKPPKSTLMIMYPDLYILYLINEVDITVNVTISLKPTEELLYRDSLGAYYVMLILIRFVGEEIAKDIAIGWRGDLAHLYRVHDLSKNMWILLWNISWVSPLYAKYFYSNLSFAFIQRYDVIEVNEKRTVVTINISESVKHIVDISIDNTNVFILSKYVEYITNEYNN